MQFSSTFDDPKLRFCYQAHRTMCLTSWLCQAWSLVLIESMTEKKTASDRYVDLKRITPQLSLNQKDSKTQKTTSCDPLILTSHSRCCLETVKEPARDLDWLNLFGNIYLGASGQKKGSDYLLESLQGLFYRSDLCFYFTDRLTLPFYRKNQQLKYYFHD